MVEQDPLDALIGDAQTVRSVFDQVPVMLLGLDGPQMNFSAVNAAYRAFYPRFAMGQSLWESAPVLIDQRVDAALREVYDTGEPLQTREWRVQLDVDGSGLREVFIDMTITPRRAPDGAVLGVQILAYDVTERVLARQADQARAQLLQDRYESVRDSATLMQQALLAPAVPVLPGLDVAAAYLVATRDTAAGGDWFDVVTHPGGEVDLLVGDVVGHGVRAAAVMAQLRTAVRMQLHAGAGIAEALQAVDDFATEIPGAASATLCVLRLDPGGDVEYCTAGHPPPLTLTADGIARYLEPTGARPLGYGHPFTTRTTHLDHGDVVLLYSDGLIERPGRHVPSSTTEVADVTARVLRGEAGFALDPRQVPVERLCSHAVELLLRATGYGDDITVLAAQRRPPPPELHVDVPADGQAERAVRARLRQWLGALGGDAVSGQVLEHAVTEFVANAAQHAHVATSSGTVRVDGILDQRGRARVTVADRGRWREQPHGSADRGRGLPLAFALVPDTTIERTAGGTTVTAVHRVTRAAHIVTDAAATHAVPAPPVTDFDVVVETDGVVLVAGDVDTAAAPVLAEVLAARGLTGAAGLTIDVSAATHLGSAAISVLARACYISAERGTTCTLVAPPGGTPHHVLSLVGLPTSSQ